MIIDITPRITRTTHVWPGDNPPTREILGEISRGDTVTLSTLRSTVHLGAHADAPSHYGQDARTMEQQPLELYMGPCDLIDARVDPGSRVGIDDLDSMPTTDRVLIRTGTFKDFEQWNDDFAGLSPDLVDHLHEKGVRLIGVDTPSVDLMEDKQLLAHKRFLANDMAIVEGLRLKDVPAGRYEFVGLPLNLEGFDGSPVRAVLRSLPDSDGG
ncbi:MAG: kynurenine formamidase [Phycisphaerae bacterium]|nr:kynurenine formamidase [Phycisphaerae bacterium]